MQNKRRNLWTTNQCYHKVNINREISGNTKITINKGVKMSKKLFVLERIIPIVISISLTSCATTQNQPIVEAESFEEPEITNNLDNSLSDLTTQITNSISEDGKKKIAVIEFSDLEGNVTQFGKYLAEELITRLFRTKKFEVVERQLLNKIISEQKLSITGMIDPKSAKELGRILGVDAIVSGTITEFDADLKVNSRIISTETGKVFGVAATNIVKDDDVRKLMGIISTAQSGEVQKQTEKKEIFKEALKKVEVENFIFELINCEMSSGGRVTCDMFITNHYQDREIAFYTSGSRMFDNFGNEYKPSRGELANKKMGTDDGIRSLLISNISTKGSLIFENVTQEAGYISLLEIRCWEQESGEFKIRFRNITISK